MVVRFKKLHPDAVIPQYMTEGSAAADMVCVESEVVDGTLHCSLGLAVEIPEGFEGILKPRSSIWKKGLILANSIGTIDNDYRGEMKAIFYMTAGCSPYIPGERCVQLSIQKVEKALFLESEELSETQRGSGGFGHTGR